MIRAVLVAFLLAFSTMSIAQVEMSKGVATVTYESANISAKDKSRAFLQAQVNAIERWVAENGAAQSENFDAVRPKIEASIDNYVLGATIISEEDSPDARRYTVALRAELSVSRLRNEFKQGSVVGSTPASQKSTLTFVFVARQQDSIKSFDTHVYARNDETATLGHEREGNRSSKEGEKVSRGSIRTTDSLSENTSENATASIVTESGGSKTRKADQVSWALIPSAGFSSVVTGVFSQAGFDVVEAEYVEPESDGLLSIKALQTDYKAGDDLQPQTLRNTVEGLRNAQVPYLALATLDVGLADTDPISGLMRVYVTVNAKFLDVTSRFPKTLASVGPVQFAGTGPSPDVARTNGLKQAADSAARELANQVTAAGIH